MSAFEVYLWLTIPDAFEAIGWVSAAAALSCFCGLLFSVDEDMEKDVIGRWWKRTVFSACMTVFCLFVPSKETIALMYVLPAVTSDEVVNNVTKESKELYDIAKKALIDMAEGDSE